MYAILLLGKQCRINNSESESESESSNLYRSYCSRSASSWFAIVVYNNSSHQQIFGSWNDLNDLQCH